MGEVHHMGEIATANEEAIEAWDGPLYDRFVQFRHLLATGLGVHGNEGLRLAAPRPGERALDVGCGFGDTAQRLAELVGPDGTVVGVDASPRFIDVAAREAEAAGIENVRFEVADVQSAGFDESFDLAL